MPRDLSEFFSQYSIAVGKSENGKRTQLLAVKERILYAWTKEGLRAAVGLKYSSNEQGDVTGKRCSFEFEVKLVLTKKPEGEIEWIELNRSGSCLAICNDRRVHVVFLPRQLWLLRSLNEIEKEYLCRCVSVDDGIAKKNKGLQCLRVRWHPGSLSDRHLVTLWSDDVIRIYNVGQPSDPPTQIFLDQSRDVSSSSKMQKMRFSLGESAVSFDFGSPFDSGDNSDTELWPIFVLCGNGDVYCVIHDVKRNKHFPPNGPLVISPATDNNYGVDACDISFLHGKLPVLVIATTYGMLYHALVLQDDNGTTRNEASFKLHVYESVELEFALSTVDLASTEVKEDNETSNVIIMKDPLLSRRYYACHRAGLHSIELSWAHDLEDERSPVLPDVASDVEYVLCTAPKRSADRSESSPVGLGMVTSLSSESALIVLLSDFSICCLPAYCDAVSTLTSTDKVDGLASKKLPNRDYFIDTIKRVLQKGATVPVLRARPDKQISEQEAAEVMCRCLEVLRREYVDRLVTAKEACEKRAGELGGIFAQQSQDLVRLDESTKAIGERTRKSNQRREELAERQKALVERLERVAENMAGGETGELSAQEESMHKELTNMKDDIASTLDEVAQLKERLGALSANGRNDRMNVATPTKMHEMSVKKRLEEQQQQIESLLRAVKAVQAEIP